MVLALIYFYFIDRLSFEYEASLKEWKTAVFSHFECELTA